MNVLFVTLRFDSKDDFEISLLNANSGQGHSFKQDVMLTPGKEGVTDSNSVHFEV